MLSIQVGTFTAVKMQQATRNHSNTHTAANIGTESAEGSDAHAQHVTQALKLPFKMALRLTVDFFREVDQLSTVEVSKKKSQLLRLVDFSWILLWIYHRISMGKWKNSYKMASTSSKISVEVNSRLGGRSEIIQQFTFFEKVDQLSTSQKKNPATVDLSSKVHCRHCHRIEISVCNS
jgi:hypothetical protein